MFREGGEYRACFGGVVELGGDVEIRLGGQGMLLNGCC